MNNFDKITQREHGLQKKLTAGQMSMIAIGGAIGTGLFLGSKFAIGFAGPSVILSYAIGAFITLLLMGCLAEMTIAHPTTGSFGAYAEHYISPLAGFLVRYAYWAAIVLAVGTEITAVAEYMQFWFKDVPAWIWIVSFSSVLIAVNAFSVKAFGTTEYWFSTIKIFAIIGFIILGAYVVISPDLPEYGLHNYSLEGGFLPHGWTGMWVAVVISIFSYLSVEMIAVAAGEAENPEQAVKKAFYATILRLGIFYLTTLALIVAIVPWTEIEQGQSPFVTVMQTLKIPYAAGILNFVVVVAALSAMNSQLYITTRMMFSLARGGDAPAGLGKLNAHGIPFNALLLSTSGIALATIVYTLFPDTAFTLMVALSMFGALFTWMMIFVTHYFFRIHRNNNGGPALSFQLKGFPVTTLLGFILMLAILITTAFTEIFRMTLVFGIPFLALLILLFYFQKNRKPPIPS
ncbi:amino acid permease [Solimicrobium silvestre]|uniref:Gamma-aminobutyrate permease and related permease n=1 Tax=Solimicrobium silvestre TaxID=2099400 RepID=A0A2S9GT85_9BURK|nr:amino acid permease [Solimicrobium silvestre]PRC90911.1 Gamma-aminobutyrate permease and related permease [Solimicrobium silvestre]